MDPVVEPLVRHVLAALSALAVLSTVIVEQVKCIAQPIPVNRRSVLVTLLLQSDQRPRATYVRYHLRPSSAQQVKWNRSSGTGEACHRWSWSRLHLSTNPTYDSHVYSDPVRNIGSNPERYDNSHDHLHRYNGPAPAWSHFNNHDYDSASGHNCDSTYYSDGLPFCCLRLALVDTT